MLEPGSFRRDPGVLLQGVSSSRRRRPALPRGLNPSRSSRVPTRFWSCSHLSGRWNRRQPVGSRLTQWIGKNRTTGGRFFRSEDGEYVLYYWGARGTDHGWWVGPAENGAGGQDIIAFLPYGHRLWCAVVDGVSRQLDLMVASAPQILSLLVDPTLAATQHGQSGASEHRSSNSSASSSGSSSPHSGSSEKAQPPAAPTSRTCADARPQEDWNQEEAGAKTCIQQLEAPKRRRLSRKCSGDRLWRHGTSAAAVQAEEQLRKNSASRAKSLFEVSSDCDAYGRAAEGTTSISRQNKAMPRLAALTAEAKPERQTAEQTLPLREELHDSSSKTAAGVETEENQARRSGRTSVAVKTSRDASASDEPAVNAEAVAQPLAAARTTSDAASPVGQQLSPISPPIDASRSDEDVEVVQLRKPHRPIASPLRRRSQRLSRSRRTDAQGDENIAAQASDGIAANVACPITPKLQSMLAAAHAQVPVPETPDTKVPLPALARHQEVQQRSRDKKVTPAEGAGGKAFILASVSDSPLLNDRSRTLQEELLHRLGFMSFTSAVFGGASEARPVEQKESLPVSQVDEVRGKHIILPVPPEKVAPVSKSNADEATRHLHRASEKEEFAFLVKQVAPSITRLPVRPIGVPAPIPPASEKEGFGDNPKHEQAAYRQQLAVEREEFTFLVKKVTGARQQWRPPPGPYKNGPEHAWAAEIHGPSFAGLKDNAWVS
eukprot:TRINITY_DN15032_c0_g1_i3.p1 TRINITY_DN15032_c0_g1~~TRINITY_DN15032_c0_g1_i3.p1  ORF type:complete len:718 (+),score=126.70 TRINITY_DN15032_c0_g1_i3:68-2221(+)